MRISESLGVPISTLKLNAKILRDLHLISYGTISEPDKAELTKFGRSVVQIIGNSEPKTLKKTFNENIT